MSLFSGWNEWEVFPAPHPWGTGPVCDLAGPGGCSAGHQEGLGESTAPGAGGGGDLQPDRPSEYPICPLL